MLQTKHLISYTTTHQVNTQIASLTMGYDLVHLERYLQRLMEPKVDFRRRLIWPCLQIEEFRML